MPVPPEGAALTVDAAKQAMQISYFHWGFHIWAIYGLVGLVLAYFSFRHGLPLSMRSTLYPIIGEKIHGPAGHAVDTFAILGTMFGIATTLGLSVIQINAGLNYLWPGIPVSTIVQVIVIFVITLMAIASVVAGLDKGGQTPIYCEYDLGHVLVAIRILCRTYPSIFLRLSCRTQVAISITLLSVPLICRPIVAVTGSATGPCSSLVGQLLGHHSLVSLSPKSVVAAPFAQFVFGVMLVPTIFTFFWFSVFGDTALQYDHERRSRTR